MSQQVLELAQQGNADAIAFLLNRTLKPQGIEAKVANSDARLQVLLEGLDIPDETRMVSLVTQGVQKLQIATVNQLHIYGKQTGVKETAWKRSFQQDATGLTELTLDEVATDDFGQGNLLALAREGDLNALQTYVEQAVQELLTQARALRPALADNEEIITHADPQVFLVLEETLLQVTIETTEFLDGPTFSADLGKKLNMIASPAIKAFELYKRKHSAAQPFFIQRLVLDQSLQSRL
ncbi:hypothetical protein ACN4EG_14660 [Alkalinema pantanalense CENA528]|uniref:hypothetical protein n=1 Tax=Alkalinema pantanalense TaxID=1620705 RepID=UPI003D6FF1A9